MRDCKIFCSLISSCILLFSVLNGANADNPYRFYTWKITYGDIYPLGVKQRGILINGQFPGPHIDCVTNDNLIISVYNYLNEPFLISCEVNSRKFSTILWTTVHSAHAGSPDLGHIPHFLSCPQGLLGKHFEKLIQCDPRLNFLSK
ncbi:unnamed protein product [Coffea canephora]|uniref:DH200=94 genomic scaffold, scaffold_2816 n=1 Tax=Coffea canephora TaxID=49390 RepID=A0A068VKK1_COFCA|nr:unnamed protein product [Coffea canephora]